MLIGRVFERQALARHLASARIGNGGVLVVAGEPGIGKTALLAEARATVTDMQVVQLRGLESEREVAFAGLQQLCSPFLGQLGSLPAPQRGALEVALALDVGRPPARFALGAAVLGLLTRVAESRALAVFVDDVHLLDESSAQALAFAGRRLSSDPVAVVASARSPEPSALDDLPRLSVGPLSVDETRALLGRSSPRAWDDEQLQRLHASTAGNPLAVLELADSSEDLLAAPPDAPVALTGELLAAYSRRILRLPADARAALLLAATDSHDLTALHRACAAAGLSLEVLTEAERAGLVRLVGESVEFTHPLVRAAAYGIAEPPERRRAHRLIADSLGPEERDRRAWHSAEASISPDDQVAALLGSAAGASAARGAHAVASAQFERAARLSPGAGARGERLRRAGELAWLAGASDRATALLEQALRDARSPLERSRVRGRLGAIAARCGSLADARDMLLRAADEAEPADRDAAALLLADAVEACLYLCDGASALATADRLVAVADAAPPGDTRRLSCLAAGIAYLPAGRGDRGARLIRDALEPSDGTGPEPDPWRRSWTLVGPLFLREAGSSRAAMDAAVGRVRELSTVGVLPLLLTLTAKDEATTHRWDTAESGYTEAIRLAAETGHSTDEALALAGLAWLEARQGRAEDCRAHAERALDLGTRHEVHLARVWARFALADLAAAAGDAAGAVIGYEALVQLLAELRFSDPDVWPGPELVECHSQLGQQEQAERVAAQFATAALAKGQPWAIARAHRALAITSEGDVAEQRFAAALAAHERAPEPYESARTLLAQGTWLRRVRRRSDARQPLRAALADFERIGARPWADRAAAELAATGERARRRDDAATTALTPQERQIAAMLARGHTTRETAAALFLSPKTVEYHLRHVYLKLAISSREELARAFADEA